MEGSQGAATASPSFTAVDLQQSGEVMDERLRHVERGRIGDHLEPLVRGLGLRKSRPTRGSASLRDSNPALPSQDQLAEKPHSTDLTLTSPPKGYSHSYTSKQGAVIVSETRWIYWTDPTCLTTNWSLPRTRSTSPTVEASWKPEDVGGGVHERDFRTNSRYLRAESHCCLPSSASTHRHRYRVLLGRQGFHRSSPTEPGIGTGADTTADECPTSVPSDPQLAPTLPRKPASTGSETPVM